MGHIWIFKIRVAAVAVALLTILSFARPVAAIQSDDFSADTLNTTLWRVMDPVGDVSVVATGTNLLVHIPGGTSHDLWNTCNCAPRLLQPAAAGDFEVEVKFDSKVEKLYHIQGIIVAQDDDTFLRFDIFHDGVSPNIFVAFVDGPGFPATELAAAPLADVPAYLRVRRTGDVWNYEYSFDGVAWLSAGSFTRAIAASEVGFYAGSVSVPEYRTKTFVGNIDYFFNTANPISPDDGGAPTAATPPHVEVWYGDTQAFGQLGQPQTIANVVGHVWDTDALSTLAYTLNGGASAPLTMGPDGLRLVHLGDYNVEIDFADLVAGANQIVISAIDTLGERTDTTVTIDFTGGVTWAFPDTIDWASAAKISDVAQVVDGSWHLTAGGVRTDSSQTGYDRLLVAGDYRWTTDYEVTLPLTIHESGLGGPGGVGLALGWQGHTGQAQPKLGHPYQAFALVANFPAGPKLQLLRNGDLVQGEMPISISANTRYILKVRSQSLGTGMSQVSAKLWQDGSGEPPTWDLVSDFTTLNGSVLLIAHYSDVTFGNVDITPVAPGALHTLTVNVNGSGSVIKAPNLSLYPDGSSIELTAVPDVGWVFDTWSDGLSGGANPDTIASIVSDTTVTANFSAIPLTLVTSVPGGGGTITVQPNNPTYAYGDTIVLTAVPDSGLELTAWGGDLTGTQNPDTLTITSNMNVTATFGPTTYTLTVTTVGNGSVSVAPNQPSYAPGTLVELTAIPDSAWVFSAWSGDLAGESNPDTVVISADKSVTGAFVLDSGIQSDDFSSTTLDTSLWRFEDPVGDVTRVMTGTNLLVHVPGGTSHDAWNTCNCATRFLQSSVDTDFEIEIKFDSIVELRHQIQGFMVMQDADTYLRFDVFHDGTSPWIFAAFVDGAPFPTTHIASPLLGVPSYLRVKRRGDDWGFTYSFDGMQWMSAGNFSRVVTVTEVGFLVGSQHSQYWNTPTHVGNVDYFFSTAQVISPEDGGAPTAASPPVIDYWYGDNQQFGHLGNPQTLIQVPGNIWDTDALTALSYTLNAGTSQPLTWGPDGLRLVASGDFVVEIDNVDLLSGANQIAVTAVDTLGESITRTVTVNYVPGQVWALPDTIVFAGATAISDVAQVVDGRWIPTVDGVRTDSSKTGYDRMLVVGDFTTPTEYEIVLPLTIHAGGLGNPGGIGIGIGWQGHTGPVQPKFGHPYQAIAWITGFPLNPKLQLLQNGDLVTSEVAVSLQSEVKYLMKMRSESDGGGSSVVQMKLWEDGTAEPATWALSDTFATLAGSVLLIAHHSDVTFGNTVLSPILPTPTHTLTTQVIGNGTIVRNPDQPVYNLNDLVEVAVMPDSGWLFDRWSGDLTSTSLLDTITITGDLTVTATFLAMIHDVTTEVVGGGSVMVVPPRVFYALGEKLLVIAQPDSGWTFGAWSGSISGSVNPDTLVVAGSDTVRATFLQEVFGVNVSVVGQGTVNRSPDKPLYAVGETVILSANAASGYQFSAWSGGLVSLENPDTVTVDSTLQVTATFNQISTGIGDIPSIAALTVLQNVPNPFANRTQIDFSLPRAGDVNIEIFDVAGRRVFERQLRGLAQGWNRFSFDGVDVTGHRLATGIYFYRIRSRAGSATKKMVLMH